MHVEMNRLKAICNLDTINSSIKNLYNSHVIIKALNTTSLCQHYEDINHDHNLQMFHILCLIKTRIHHASTNVHKFINSSKYSYISIHDGHGLMMMYDIHVHLDSFNIKTSDGSKYITTTFNINTQKTIHIICVHKIHSCSISTFLNNLQTIIQQSPKHCPIIIMGDFNVDILKDNN
jgi:endonuclease/exonuclease/phosphatase family metal-dependent hydrolase